jgi:hypothetical protein
MPSRKQKRREAKSKRHEYEFVYLDSEGNELEEPPEELGARARAKPSSNGSKAPAKAAKQQAPQTRGRREPQPPSWQRAGKRALILGAIVFALFTLTARKRGGYAGAITLALVYTALFIPFTYMVDRFAYKRFQARKESGSSRPPRQPKKR